MPNPHPSGSFWHYYAEVFGAPDIKYCEETIAHFFSEPSNTWSNLPMIFLGFLIYIRRKKGHNLIDHYGIAFATMGFFSFTYHLSNNYASQFLDFLGMYCTVGMIMFLNFKRLGLFTESKVKSLYLLSFIPFSIMVFVFRTYSIPVQISIILLVLVILSSELLIYLKKIQLKLSYKYLFIGSFFLALAATSQFIDVNRLYCDPKNHILQPHAFWHLFNAAAFYYFYFYFKEADDLCS